MNLKFLTHLRKSMHIYLHTPYIHSFASTHTYTYMHKCKQATFAYIRTYSDAHAFTNIFTYAHQ